MIVGTGPCRTVGTVLTSTAVFPVYSVDKTYSTIASIWITNITASPVNATVTWFDEDLNTSFTLAFQTPVAVGDALLLQFDGFQLAEGDEIRVQAGTSNALHVIVTVLEVPGRST